MMVLRDHLTSTCAFITAISNTSSFLKETERRATHHAWVAADSNLERLLLLYLFQSHPE